MIPPAGKRAQKRLWPREPASRPPQPPRPVAGAAWQHGPATREAHIERQRKRILGLIVIAALVIITVILMIELVRVPFRNDDRDDDQPAADAALSTSQTWSLSATSSSPQVQGVAQAAPNPAGDTVHRRPSSSLAGSLEPSSVVRLMIPIIGVDAPVVVKSLDANQTMESPEQPFEVAWYDFSGVPGRGGNAIFAGHYDFRDAGPAVFWDLDVLTHGNTIAVYLEDGSRHEYQVTSVDSYLESEAPVQEIVAPTSTESITLITCGGTFDEASGSYDQRLVVRAERIPETTP